MWNLGSSCLLGIFSILCPQTTLLLLGFSVWKALGGPSLVRLVKAFYLKHTPLVMQRRKNLIIIVHSCCFYINWLVTPGLKKGSCVHESHFPNKLCCESNVVLERSRLITELIQKGCRALFILSLLHFKAMEMEPLSPLYYSCIQRDWNGSHTILVWPWAALSYPPEILPQSLKKGRKEQDFLNFFFFNSWIYHTFFYPCFQKFCFLCGKCWN